jgi:hypothetical protein
MGKAARPRRDGKRGIRDEELIRGGHGNESWDEESSFPHGQSGPGAVRSTRPRQMPEGGCRIRNAE